MQSNFFCCVSCNSCQRLPVHPLVAFIVRSHLCGTVCSWTSLLSVKYLFCLGLYGQKTEMVTCRLCVFLQCCSVQVGQRQPVSAARQECLDKRLSDLQAFYWQLMKVHIMSFHFTIFHTIMSRFKITANSL